MSETNPHRHHVVIQTAFLGDVILSTLLLRRLHMAFPGDGVILVCRSGFGDFIRQESPRTRVIEMTKTRRGLWNVDTRKILEELQTIDIGHVFCPHPSPRSALIARLIRASGRRIGFRSWWNPWAFSARIPRPHHLPDALRQLSLLGAVDPGIAAEIRELTPTHPLANSSYRGGTIDLAQKRIPESLALSPAPQNRSHTLRRVLLAPGSQWKTKQWTKEGFTEVSAGLRTAGFEVGWIGSAQERRLCNEMALESGGSESENFAGIWSLTETTREMRNSRLVIANDSGAGHLAALTGTPVISVFGPTTPAQGFRPWLTPAVIVQTDLPCRPCGPHGHQACPLKTHACMKRIAGKDVLATALLVLRGGAR